MKSAILIAIFVFASVIGCASVVIPPPNLELRTLRISRDIAGFEYQWFECARKGLFGNCLEWVKKIEYYDLTDKTVRNKLIDMGFVANVKEKLTP